VKILILTNLYPPHGIGGYEERCRRVVDGLRGRGHRVRVLTSSHRTGTGGSVAEEEPGLIRRSLRIHGFFGHPWLPPQSLFWLERHNQAELRAQLEGFRPDIVHVWNLGGLSKAFMLSLQAWGGPVVYDVSDHWIARSLRADVWLRWWNGDAGGLPAKLLRVFLRGSGLARIIDRRAPFGPWESLQFKNIYFCSAALRELTLARGWPVGHARVIYCGVETELYAPRPPSARFERLLYVGRLDPDKDPLTAILALGELHKAGRTQFSLDLYGRGDAAYVQQLKFAASRCGVSGQVAFQSAASTEMPSVYGRYDALLFTSAWEEPFALTPLEAMAARLPVVGTPSGGSRELFREGENGLVFPAGDFQALAAAVARLADDAALRERIAATGHREVREAYDLKAITGQIEAFLLETAK